MWSALVLGVCGVVFCVFEIETQRERERDSGDFAGVCLWLMLTFLIKDYQSCQEYCLTDDGDAYDLSLIPVGFSP